MRARAAKAAETYFIPKTMSTVPTISEIVSR